MRGSDVPRHMSDCICASTVLFVCNQDAAVKHIIAASQQSSLPKKQQSTVITQPNGHVMSTPSELRHNKVLNSENIMCILYTSTEHFGAVDAATHQGHSSQLADIKIVVML